MHVELCVALYYDWACDGRGALFSVAFFFLLALIIIISAHRESKMTVRNVCRRKLQVEQKAWAINQHRWQGWKWPRSRFFNKKGKQWLNWLSCEGPLVRTTNSQNRTHQPSGRVEFYFCETPQHTHIPTHTNPTHSPLFSFLILAMPCGCTSSSSPSQ